MVATRSQFAASISKKDAIIEHYKDFAGGEYDESVTQTYGYEAHVRIPEQILARTAGREGLKILDLGCGTGLVARPFFDASATHDVTGVDVTPAMTESASKLPYRRVITATAQEALAGALRGERFDVVLLVGMMEFIEDPPPFVRTVAAALAEGGLLGLAVPHKQSFSLERRFGILTHPFEPMEEALRGSGLTLDWTADFNGYTLDDGRTQVKYKGSVWSKPAAATGVVEG